MQQKPLLTSSKLAVVLLLCLIVKSPLIPHAYAQATPEFAVTVTPQRAYLKIKPGNTSAHTITVKNEGSQVLTITPRIVDFKPDGVTGSPLLLDTLSFPYINYNSLDLSPLQLGPNQDGQLTLSFNVPASAATKEYPLSILFEAQPTAGEFSLGSSSSTTGIIVSNLIVLVTNQEPDKNISVTTFNSTRFIDSFGSISFAPIAQNNSFGASVASGSATIKNWRSQTIAEFPLYPDTILGYSTREIRSLITQAQENTVQEEGPAISPGSFKYNPHFLFGIYTITLTLDNSTSETLSLQETQFTVIAFPFSILLGLALAAGVYWGYTLYTKKSNLF